MAEIRGVLIDLGGVVFEGNRALPGSIEAVAALRATGLGMRFLTNTTSRPLRQIVDQLRGFGMPLEAAEVFTPGDRGAQLSLGT